MLNTKPPIPNRSPPCGLPNESRSCGESWLIPKQRGRDPPAEVAVLPFKDMISPHPQPVMEPAASLGFSTVDHVTCIPGFYRVAWLTFSNIFNWPARWMVMAVLQPVKSMHRVKINNLNLLSGQRVHPPPLCCYGICPRGYPELPTKYPGTFVEAGPMWAFGSLKKVCDLKNSFGFRGYAMDYGTV